MKKVPTVGVDALRNIKLLDNPWHDAEAYHFLMLSQRQLMDGKLIHQKLILSFKMIFHYIYFLY